VASGKEVYMRAEKSLDGFEEMTKHRTYWPVRLVLKPRGGGKGLWASPREPPSYWLTELKKL